MTSIFCRLAVITALMCMNALLFGYLAAMEDNTLVNNGAWHSGKEKLEIRVMGAESFTRRSQALAHGQLNLGAWHGYQEVYARDKMRFTQAHFDFLLEDGAYVCLVMKEEDRVSGFRFSAREDMPCVYFEAKPTGEFIRQQPLDPPLLSSGEWHHGMLEFNDSAPALSIDEHAVRLENVRRPVFCQPGFRGSERSAVVDNVQFLFGSYPQLADNFLLLDNFWRDAAMAAFGLLVMTLILAWILLISTRPPAWHLAPMAFQIATAAVLAPSVFLMPGYLAKYPHPSTFIREESIYLYNQTHWQVEEISGEIRDAQAAAKPMVFLMGSSQTFGAGASSKAASLAGRLQAALDSSEIATPLAVINAGQNGQNSETLVAQYEKEWPGLVPAVVVVNLSVNDRFTDQDAFVAAIKKLIEITAARGSKLLLALEPYSPEWKEENHAGKLATHQLLRDLASEHGVPMLDMHALLLGHANQGFLWWDFVHPTDFGHQLIAEYLAPEIRRLLDEKVDPGD